MEVAVEQLPRPRVAERQEIGAARFLGDGLETGERCGQRRFFLAAAVVLEAMRRHLSVKRHLMRRRTQTPPALCKDGQEREHCVTFVQFGPAVRHGAE